MRLHPRARLLVLALLAVAVAGCELFPLPAPPNAVLPETSCPREAGPAGSLGCIESVRAAVEALPKDHAPILRAAFVFGPCDCPAAALCDCAIHHVGTVTLLFGENRSPVTVRVSGVGGRITAQIEAPPTIPGR
jgi:hypothetical protein